MQEGLSGGTKDADPGSGALVAPSAAQVRWATFVTILVAAVVYAAIACLMFRVSDHVFTLSHNRATLTQRWSEENRDVWSVELLVGGFLGFPGAILASILLAPRRPSSAPLVGTGVGTVHYLLGFALLKVLWWAKDDKSDPIETMDPFMTAGLVFLLGGWIWAYAVRLWSRGRRRKGGVGGR